MMPKRDATIRRAGSAAGFSLIELLVSTGITITVMGATMGAMMQAVRSNETAMLVTSMNSNLRTAMDLLIRDLLQVGSGLPPGHFVLVPQGGGTQVKLPGPPGTAFLLPAADTDLNAVNPFPAQGPTVAGLTSDVLTILHADSTFNDIQLTARAADGTNITVVNTVNIGTGPDRVIPGQLIMLEKGSVSILLQVTSVDAPNRRIYFAAGDSLALNQHTAPNGSSAALTAAAPSPDTSPLAPATVLNTTATRVRMVTYYIDNTDTLHPTLVRRINNGSPTTFSNSSGTAVAFDIDRFEVSYDIADGVNNPSGVRFVAADLAGTGACAPSPCSVNQVRKVNILLGGRSRALFSSTRRYFHNQLNTQVSLRSMAFVNEYVQ